MKHPDWFDPDFYLRTYTQVRDVRMDPWALFLQYGYQEGRRPSDKLAVYDFDGLVSRHNCDFMQDPAFLRAYNRGSQAARGVAFN